MATVVFRDFEPRDLDFIHKCKTDAKLNGLIVGNWKPFTLEQSKSWLDGCIRADNPKYKFWAIATNDELQRIVGWCSLSNIDFTNRSACFHGILINDPDYNDGIAWIETNLFIFEYTFEKLKLNRLYGTALLGHKTSNAAEYVFYQNREGVQRQAIYKNGRFYDLVLSAILRDEYIFHKQNGDFSLSNLLRRIRDYKTIKQK